MAQIGTTTGKKQDSQTLHKSCAWENSDTLNDASAWPSIGEDGDSIMNNSPKSVILSSPHLSPEERIAADHAMKSSDEDEASTWPPARQDVPSSALVTASLPRPSSSTSFANNTHQSSQPPTSIAMSEAVMARYGWSGTPSNNSMPGAPAWQQNHTGSAGDGSQSPSSSSSSPPASLHWQSQPASSTYSGWGHRNSSSSSPKPAQMTEVAQMAEDEDIENLSAMQQYQQSGAGNAKDASSSVQGQASNTHALWSKSPSQWNHANGTTASSGTGAYPSGSAASPLTPQPDASTTFSSGGSWSALSVKSQLQPIKASLAKPVADSVDEAVQLQMQKAINTTESWGRTPIRQDTSWLEPGSPLDTKKTTESNNTWNSLPNNGTGIWEASKKVGSVNGVSAALWEDKKGSYSQSSEMDDGALLWNPGSKSKDMMWDDATFKEPNAEQHRSNWQPGSTVESPTWNGDRPGGVRGGGNRIRSTAITQAPERTGSSAGSADMSNRSEVNVNGGWSIGGGNSTTAGNTGSSTVSGGSGWSQGLPLSRSGGDDCRLPSGWEDESGSPLSVSAVSNANVEMDSGAQHWVHHGLQQQQHGSSWNGQAAQPAGTGPVPVSRQPSLQGSRDWNGRTDSGGGPRLWDQQQGGASRSSNSSTSAAGDWSGGSGTAATGSWLPPQGGSSGRQSRMPSQGWEEGGGSEWSGGVSGPPRLRKSDSDATAANAWRDDSVIDEWSDHKRKEVVWTSASGPRRGVLTSKQGATHGMLNKPMVGGGGSGPVGFVQPPPTRQHMIQTLMDMGFSKENAQKALIDNDMDLNSAIANLRCSGASQPGTGQPAPRALLPSSMGATTVASSLLSAFDAGSIPATYSNVHTMHTNTHFSNAQATASANTKSLIQQPSSSRQPLQSAAVTSPSLPKVLSQQHGQHMPLGPNRGSQGSQGTSQQQVMQNLQYLINLGFIPANALKQTNPQIIEQMLKLFSVHQALSIAQMHQGGRGGVPLVGPGSQQTMEHNQAKMSQIKTQLVALSKLIQQQHHQQQQQFHSQAMQSDASLLAEFSNINISVPPSYTQPPQAQSKLSQWKLPPDSDMTSGCISSRAPGSKPAITTYSASSVHGGLGIITDNTWSSGAPGSSWPSNSSKMDGNHNESQSPPDMDSQIPEFVPGQPWPGMNLHKAEDDPTLTPGNTSKSYLGAGKNDDNETWPSYSNFPRSLSMTGSSDWAASGGNALAMAPGLGSSMESSWAQPATGGAGASRSLTSTTARPPPGLGGGSNAGGNKSWAASYNRSTSWAPTSSAAAPGGAGMSWDRPQWLMLYNLAAHIDHSLLKTLCAQHGALTNFYVNLQQGLAFVQYSRSQDAAKAHNSLHSCVLANTTIAAELVGDEEVSRIIDPNTRTNQYNSRFNNPASWGNQQQPSLWNGGSMSGGGMGGGGGVSMGNLWSGGGLSVAMDAASSQSFLPGDLLSAGDFTM